MTDWNDEGTVRTIRRTPPARGASFELRVIEGPDAGAVHAFDPASSATVFLGQSALCGLRLTENEAAARQCAIELKDGRLRIVDLSPAKNTRINGVFAHEAHLVGGEVIRIGATVIAVRRVDTTPWLANAERRSFGRVLGESPEMLALFPLFAILAESGTLVVLEGERGSGKRLLAEELHARGPRSAGPFVVVPRSEPSSALDQLATARGGTLYVEEGALLDREALAALVNADDVRVIVGTRGETALPSALCDRVVLPALRDRDGDVAALARSFWTVLGGEGSLPDDFVARYEDHRWPGNVRELRIAVHDRVRHGSRPLASDIFEIANDGAAARPSVTEDAIERILENDLPFTRAREEMLAEFERRYVDRALTRANHNVARAAAISGIAHRYFQVLKSRRKTA